MTKKWFRLTKLMAGRLSSEFTQTFIFPQTLNNRLQHSRRATQLRQFKPDSDFGSIFFLNYNARACSVSLHLAQLTQVGKPKCILAWQTLTRRVGGSSSSSRAKTVFRIETVGRVFQRNVKSVGSPRES